MEPLKNIFNKESISKIGDEIKHVYPEFEKSKFIKKVVKNLEDFELKDRVRHIAKTLHEYLPSNYKKAVKIILGALAIESSKDDIEWNRQTGEGIVGLNTWPLNQYIEIYGVNDYKTSMHAMIELTKRFSSEFTVRPFIQKYNQAVFDDLKPLLKHKNPHVRRWISEGTRPLLPWGMKVDSIQANLKRNIPYLLELSDDESKYVRLSVANHLNDISKLDSKLMLKACKKIYKKQTPESTWLVKHATRGLLKAGNQDALILNGYMKNPKFSFSNFRISTKKIKEGDRFELSFDLESKIGKGQKLLIEYIIYYPKKNGKLSPKPFRLKDFDLKGNEKKSIKKVIHFKKVSTRVHYLGTHLLQIQLNGEIVGELKFELLCLV